MTAADKIAEARALIEPLTGHTPGPWMQDGIAIAHPSEPNGYPLDICLMGEPLHFAGDVRPMLQNHEANARILVAVPALRDTVAALADLADAQAQEIAKLRGLLWYAWHEFNAIRARDGAPRGSDTCCGRLGPTLVSEEWWNTLTEAFADAIGADARTPWPSPEAKDVGEALKATP